MDKINEFKNKLLSAWAKTEPFRSKAGKVIGTIGKWLFHLRGLWLAVPVVLAAITLAIRNSRILPETVGINILADGSYQWMVDRSAAVMWPLVITGACLVLMFCSRKTIYPWLISVFTLVLPIVIYITNVFPA